jgi:hypothetical protein
MTESAVTRRAVAMRLYLLILLLFFLSACATEGRWYQKGKAEADMEIDKYECQTTLRDKYGMFGGDKHSPAYEADLRQCMTAKGYSVLEKK